MFKEENQIWLYLIGIIAMFSIMLTGTSNLLIPALRGNKDISTSLTTRPPLKINTALDYQARVMTNLGDFTIDLFEKNAPENVNNFVYLSENNYYNNTKFHRLVKNFILQGGDRNTINGTYDSYGKGKPVYTIEDEINWESLNLPEERRNILSELDYSSTPNLETQPLKKYYVAMANDGPNTNGSQFFIVLSSNDDRRLKQLDGIFTPIGKIVDGFEILDKINSIEVDNPDSNAPRPTVDIIVEQIEILTK